MKIYQCDLCGRQVDPADLEPSYHEHQRQLLISVANAPGCVADKFPEVKEICHGCFEALGAARSKAQEDVKDQITEAILKAAYMRWNRVPDNVAHDSDCSVFNGPAYPAGECDCSLSRAKGKVAVAGVKADGWDEPPCWAGDIDPPADQGERVIWKYDAPCNICGKAERKGHFHICRGTY